MFKKSISQKNLKELLLKASKAELLAITHLIDEHNRKRDPYELEHILKEISTIGGNTGANYYRGTDFFGIVGNLFSGEVEKAWDCIDNEGLTYIQNLEEIIDTENINLGKKFTYKRSLDTNPYKAEGMDYIEEAEKKIAAYVLDKTYEEMDPSQKKDYVLNANRLAKEASMNSSIKYSIPCGAIAAGQLGGFATYTLMSTVLSSASASTLSFAVYMGASKTVAFLIGSGGIGIVASYAILDVFSANTQKIIPIVVLIGDIRQRIKHKQSINNEVRKDVIPKKRQKKETQSSDSSAKLIARALSGRLRN